MMTRVPRVGARAKICRGCMRTSVAELIGMLESNGLGNWPTFARAFPKSLGGAPRAHAGMSAQTLTNNAMSRLVAIRLKREAR